MSIPSIDVAYTVRHDITEKKNVNIDNVCNKLLNYIIICYLLLLLFLILIL
jgi:hypothetical protein